MARLLNFLIVGGVAALAVSSAQAAVTGNADAGKKVFAKCGVCHIVEQPKNKVGPTLNGVIGRTAGTAADFKYSTAMIAAGKAGLVWNDETLAEYLPEPKKKVPGTKMAFAGLKNPQDIADVIAYIKQFSPAPAN